ncbi:MAG: MipA/OmpV family protein [Pseudomonadota bacterium]
MKPIFLFIVCFLIPLSTKAATQPEEGWNFTVGTGALFAPSYFGDDEYQISIVPNIQIKYEDKFFASTQEGVGYNALKNENWRIGPILRYDFGRDEDGEGPFQITSGNNDLVGLGDVDGTVELGGFVEYKFRPFSAKLEIRQGVGGHDGLIGQTGLSYSGRGMISDRPFFYSLGPEIVFAGENYHESYFNVNAAQAIASGLSAYDADGGLLSYNFGGTMIMPLTENISAVFLASYNRLGEESADSSLVDERGSPNQFTTGAFINYSF